MPCPEMQRLEDAWSLHREAALALVCGDAKLPRLLIKVCRADQARARHALTIHRRDCTSCRIPHP